MNQTEAAEDDPLGRETDFSKSIPNPYWLGVVNRRCVRLLEADLAEIFPDNASVNAALRTIAEAAARTPRKLSARTATAKAPRKARS